MTINAQTGKFEKTVEYLFFNVDVSSFSESLVDSFKSNKSLTYEPPTNGAGSVSSGIIYHHKFFFTGFKVQNQVIDSGAIDIELEVYPEHKFVQSIYWTSSFNNLVKAKAVFEELKSMFVETKAAKKIYRFDSMQMGEFIDKSSGKYPHLYMALNEKTSPDKTYDIVIFWNKKLQFEK